MSSSSSAGATSVRPPRLPTRSSTASVTRCSETSRTRASRSGTRGAQSRMATGWARPRDAPDEVVGFHLEQAHNYRTELGPADRRAKQLAADAGAHLGSAGMRAWRMNDSGDGEPARARERAAAARRLVAPRAPVRARCRRARWRAGRTGRFVPATGGPRGAKEAKDVRVELRARLELGYFELGAGRAAQALLEIAQHAYPPSRLSRTIAPSDVRG